MSDYFRKFYRERARQFDRLAAREDRQGRLFAALNDIVPLDDLLIVEFGAGSGRLTRLLSMQAQKVFAFDIEPAMLDVARENLSATGLTNWTIGVADNISMPLADNCAELVIEGWSFAHTAAFYGCDWFDIADRLHAEMRRLLRPGGIAILIETLGLGRRQPEPPTEWLADLYAHWQEAHGFKRRWIRTDFQFASLDEAEELLVAFFGADEAAPWLRAGKLIVPECSGIWWKRFE